MNTIAYTRMDNSHPEILWHVASSSEPTAQRPAIISGQRMLWCGKYDAGWVVAGYPNLTTQILYIDTGAHAGPYYFMFDGNLSCETTFDWMSIIGGGDNARDPLGNGRQYFDKLARYGLGPSSGGSGGPTGHSDRLVAFTGNMAGGDFPALGQDEIRTGEPLTGHYTIGPIDADHRAIYIVFRSDDTFSSQDGLWSQGHGMQLDNIDTSDNGALYTDQAPAGGVDAYQGNVVVGTPASPIISCRVYPGVGNFWWLAPGSALPTADFCAPQQAASSNLMFRSGDPVTNSGIPWENETVMSCAFPVPPGTSAVIATYDGYQENPNWKWCLSDFSYRCYKDGSWSDWYGSGEGTADKTWVRRGVELDQAVYADSVQLGFWVGCNSDGNYATNPGLFDNLSLQFVNETALPRGPSFGSISGPRTTFIDGTIHGVNCTATPCWPGLTDDDAWKHDDNWNDEDAQDLVGVQMSTGLRKRGLGINWRKGGRTQTEAWGTPDRSGYNSAYDVPRTIFRLFDPSTFTWSPWDSMEFIANLEVLDPDGAGAAPPETTVSNDVFGVDWPPPEKVAAGASLPGGFTINGVGAYANLHFLPRGTRMQYYFKAVDIDGGVTYNFNNVWTTVDDGELPNLPCHDSPGCVGPKPPGIREWAVLPGVYPPGPPGSLLAGRTNTPILVLDDDYGPVSVALRALGVRADHHYHVPLQLGGHGGCDNCLDAWPNQFEYPIIDSLAAWYRIIIVPMHRTGTFEGSTWGANFTALELLWWYVRDTGTDGGDRCLFLDGDNAHYGLQNNERAIMTYLSNATGVASAAEVWSGAATAPYPNIDDRFTAPGAGPALGAPGGFTYTIDGGCPDPLVDSPSRFDALTMTNERGPVMNPEDDPRNQSIAFYPNGQVAGIMTKHEYETVLDKDRQKSLTYGFSTDAVRDPGIPPSSSAYDNSGITARARILYKFLTGCRGARTSAPSDTGKCWPCPAPGTTFPLLQSDWAGQASGFQTATYGPLYPIQAGLLSSGVLEGDQSASAPRVNRIDGNYPNPFNPRTTLRFTSAVAGRAEVRIFGVGGRLVRVLRVAVKAGPNEVAWDVRGDEGERLASGVYYYKILFPDARSLVAPNHLVIVK